MRPQDKAIESTPFPNFRHPTFFPPFTCCPITSPDQAPDDPFSTRPLHFLLGTLSENMTLSTNPTLICKDVATTPFAVVIDLSRNTGSPLQEQPGIAPTLLQNFDFKPFRKGHTLVIRNARRHGVGEKQGFIKVAREDVTIIPASIDTLLSMSDRNIAAEKLFNNRRRGQDNTQRFCQACGRGGRVEQFSRCLGCGAVWYCNKDCQVDGWNTKGHKTECRVFKVVGALSLGGQGWS